MILLPKNKALFDIQNCTVKGWIIKLNQKLSLKLW